MTQLVTPCEALGGAFELPRVEDTATAQRAGRARTSESLTAYALEIHNMGLLLPVDTPSTLIEDALPFCRLPNTPQWLRGMANWHGSIVPMFDLATLLGFSDVGVAVKTLIIGQGEAAVGVLVQSQPFRITLQSEDKLTRNPPLPTALQPFARACYRTDRVWVDWDYQGFFSVAGARV